MLYYAKIINEETKECLVPNQIEAKKYLYNQYDLEIGYNGKFYLKGYAPTKSIEELQNEVRAIRNQYLIKYVDPYQLVIRWNTLTQDEQNNITNYRQYLLDYTNQPNWWEENPKTFEEWSK